MFRYMRCSEHDHSSFIKLLQMEKNHKNTDCYFFYYSTCTRGDSCAYRHEASALGCETVCSYWQQGSCLNQHCNFRHMEIKKNRKVIPCYWEKFPGGCKKPHCPFLHRQSRNIANPIEPVKTTGPSPAKPANQEWSNRPDAKFDGNSTESEQNRNSSEAGSFIGSPAVVDPLIVNFEEESDSESAPSPSKIRRNRVSSCKTYEEIRLEEIQAESAAFYSYSEHHQQLEQPQYPYPESPDTGGEKAVKSRLGQRPAPAYEDGDDDDKAELDFEILSLEEIRKRRKKKQEADEQGETEVKVVRQAIVVSRPEEKDQDFFKDAIKTLDELRGTKPSRALTERRKRSIELVSDDVKEQSAKRPKSEETKVRPIRLRRSRLIVTSTSIEGLADNAQQKDKRPEDVDVPSSRRQSVEIRMCDSSTDDNQSSKDQEAVVSATLEVEGTNKEGSDGVTKITKLDGACDSGAIEIETEANEEDDILKDIDALLS